MQIYEPRADQSPVPPDEDDDVPLPADIYPDILDTWGPDGERGDFRERPARYYVNDVAVTVATQRVQYLDADGKLITESLTDYTRKAVRQAYASLDAFLRAWNDAERKQAIVEELAGEGVFLDELAEQVGREVDAFDLICHIAYDQPPLTRRERAERVRKRNVFGKYGEAARAVLGRALGQVRRLGLKSVESLEILKVAPLSTFGTPIEIVGLFGGKPQYLAAIQELEAQLYEQAA